MDFAQRFSLGCGILITFSLIFYCLCVGQN